MSGLIFLSYRRGNTAGYAGRLADDLAKHFGAEEIFRDIAAIEAGSDFVSALDRALASAKVVLVLIGPDWLDESDDDGRRRLDDDQDFVRREVTAALGRDGVTVFPVLLEKARMPTEKELPAPMAALARRQAIELSESRWKHDLQRLTRAIQQAGVGRAWWYTRLSRAVGTTFAVFLVAAMVALGWWRFGTPDAADYLGVWHLPNGSFWTVRQVNGAVTIDETHYDSKQVWKRGTAQIDASGMSAELKLVFESRPYRYRYRLQLSSEGDHLIGEETELASNRTQTVTLSR